MNDISAIFETDPAQDRSRARCLSYLKQLGHEDSVTEIRIIGAAWYRGQVTRRNKATLSGYYDAAHYAQAVQDLQPYNGIGNIYATLNPVAPEIHVRAHNRLVPFPQSTTSDDEVTRINWLPIDIDPYRPSNVPSSTPELHAALARRDEVLDHIESLLGPGHCITGMSGNGAHILIRVDLPNDPPSRAAIKRIGDALVVQFSDPRETGSQIYSPPRVGLDSTVYNPARIWKLPGTIAVKGDSVAELDRIHRRSTIDLHPVTPVQLGEIK